MATIPDIDFSVDCPICGAGLDYDGGDFYCQRCCVSWPKDGYGHKAEVLRKDEGLCAVQAASHEAALWDGEFCTREDGHRGAHELERDGRLVARWVTPDPEGAK